MTDTSEYAALGFSGKPSPGGVGSSVGDRSGRRVGEAGFVEEAKELGLGAVAVAEVAQVGVEALGEALVAVRQRMVTRTCWSQRSALCWMASRPWVDGEDRARFGEGPLHRVVGEGVVV